MIILFFLKQQQQQQHQQQHSEGNVREHHGYDRDMNRDRDRDRGGDRGGRGGGRVGGGDRRRFEGEEVVMNVPVNRVGVIIGRGGETIRSIKQQSGCHIETDKNSKGVIIIRGPPDRIGIAQQLINEKINKDTRHNDRGGGGGGYGYVSTLILNLNFLIDCLNCIPEDKVVMIIETTNISPITNLRCTGTGLNSFFPSLPFHFIPPPLDYLRFAFLEPLIKKGG